VTISGAAHWRTACGCCWRWSEQCTLNSADFQRGGFDADDALRVAIALEAEGVHLLEIPGGTYESVAVVDGAPKRASTAARDGLIQRWPV